MSRPRLAWLPVVLWMGFIFAMSTSLGATDNTSRLIEPLLRWLCPECSTEAILRIHSLIRKAAHFTEYAVLALLVRRALEPSWPAHTGRVFLLALAISTAYAATDEFHQCFVAERTPSLADMLVDGSGALAALGLAQVREIWRRRRPP